MRRSDGSGTTFNFTDYLSKVSPEWKDKVGSSTAVSWPEGVGGKGNEGVAAYVQRIKGAIGYVEYAYAKKNNMSYALVQNRDGQYPKPDRRELPGRCCLRGLEELRRGSTRSSPTRPGTTSWPIAATSFILLHVKQDKPQNALEVLKFYRLVVEERPEDGRRARLRRRCRRAADRADRGRVEGASQGRGGQGDLELTLVRSPAAISVAAVSG